MLLKKRLVGAQRRLPVIENPELSSAVHWTPAEKLPVHRWFRYREGFSPYLLNHFPDSKHRLDPFCGCGTTLLESTRQGIHSYGIDLNPLATFVAYVKTARYSGRDRQEFNKLSSLALIKSDKLPPHPEPSFSLLDKLFLPQSLNALLKLQSFITTVESTKIRDLLLLVWLSILERSSNVFKEGNGLKYRNKRRRPGKYITLPDREWIPRYFGSDIRGFVKTLWSEKCAQVSEDMHVLGRLKNKSKTEIRTGSCLESENLDFGAPIDLAIFSPPYANRFDYFEAFKLELWMGGFVKNRTDMARLRGKSIRNNLAAKKYDLDMRWGQLSQFLEIMDPQASSVRMGIKDALEGYFYDLRCLLRNLRKTLIRKGKVVIVVGNSAYAGSIIPTDVLVARLGQEECYKIKAIRIARHLHVSSQQRAKLNHLSDFMRESVVVLERA